MKQKIYLIIPTLILAAVFHIFTSDNVLKAAYYYDQSNVNKLNNQVKQLNSSISSKKKKINQERGMQEQYALELRKKQNERATLENQLALLDNKIKQTELDIEELKIDLSLTELEVKKTNAQIDIKSREIRESKDNISAVLRSLHKQKEANMLEVLILNDNLSEFLHQVKYLEDINRGLDDAIQRLIDNKSDLEVNKLTLDEKMIDINELKGQLEEKQETLAIEKRNKEFIIEQTKNKESEYQKLIAAAKEEQRRAEADIARLARTVKERLAQIEKNKIKFNDAGFIWPVPKNVVTARFHDKSYPYRHVFEHPAIDVRARQGTTLRAAASGYVARARDAGMGYSYVMLVHGDGLSTVYGHMSAINVKEDQYVTQGHVIGKTGGMPGTRGAGRFTTGPHLHFEIRKNGVPVNPLGYLP